MFHILLVFFRCQNIFLTEHPSLGGLCYVRIGIIRMVRCPLTQSHPATPVIATLSEKYNSRKYPLLIGQLTLIGSQILLMEAKAYWVMIIARLIQGISSAVIWVVGLALL